MHVFDLFEGHEERKDAPVKPTAAQADSKDQRAVSGVRGDIYNKTNIAGVRRAIDNAIQSEPGAKSEIEAIVSYLDKQAQKNAEQEREIEKLEREEDRLRQAQDSLVKDLGDKENRFRELTAQVASGKIDQVQAARMAQDIEAGRQPQVPTTQATAQPTAAQAAPATPVARPGLPVGVGGTQTPAQPKPQAQAQTKPAAQEPTTSRALGQMAKQLAPQQGRVIQGRNQTGAPGAKVINFPTPTLDPAQAKDIHSLLAAESVMEAQLKWAVPQGASAEQIAKANLSNIVLGALAPDHPPVKMYFKDGHGPTLPWNQVAALYNYLAALTQNKTAATQADVQNMLSDSRYFYQVMLSNIVGQTPTDPVPQGQQVAEPDQPELFEGDVVPMTDNETTNRAYADALQFLNFAYANPNDPMITTIRQDFAHKYQQRFQISQAPDRSYYLLDKQLSKKYKLPTPEFKGLEEGAMKAVAMSGQGVPEKYTVVKMVGGDIVPIKAHASKAQAQLHAKNIKKKYPGMQIAVADESGQLSMIGLSEEPYDGKSVWSDGQGQWSSENNLISSGNNPHGFSEGVAEGFEYGNQVQHPKYGAGQVIRVYPNGTIEVNFPNYPDPIDKKPGVRSNFAPGDKDYQSLKPIAEAPTDYQKRRQRERDVDAGRPVAKQREPKQTDYQKRRAQDRKDQELGEENKGLYYNVNKRKKAGTSRPAGHPKAPTAQAWKDAAKTAKKESVQENYWQRLQRERAEKQHAKAWSLLEQELKDL